MLCLQFLAGTSPKTWPALFWKMCIYTCLLIPARCVYLLLFCCSVAKVSRQTSATAWKLFLAAFPLSAASDLTSSSCSGQQLIPRHGTPCLGDMLILKGLKRKRHRRFPADTEDTSSLPSFSYPASFRHPPPASSLHANKLQRAEIRHAINPRRMYRSGPLFLRAYFFKGLKTLILLGGWKEK